ncbi:glycoside hydrolase family 6 protein [Dactylosporangium aurantiacum]|nr:glycoside hydrolase family 6 protein [Dactylosporangium aurantiacum]MDG6108663.1 glycoside hydrolase family 6 protein [Dactylosporangium aurantiacum]
MDAALAQGTGYVQLVLNDLPGRDCERAYSTGDFALGELTRYRAEFVDPCTEAATSGVYVRALRYAPDRLRPPVAVGGLEHGRRRAVLRAGAADPAGR